MPDSLFIKRLLRDDRGATAIEYGLIVALIVIAIMVAMQSLASQTTILWGYVSEKVTNPQGS